MDPNRFIMNKKAPDQVRGFQLIRVSAIKMLFRRLTYTWPVAGNLTPIHHLPKYNR